MLLNRAAWGGWFAPIPARLGCVVVTTFEESLGERAILAGFGRRILIREGWNAGDYWHRTSYLSQGNGPY